MCDLTNKQKYMIHYRMFKFYIKMGMNVKKIHTIYRFKQSLWLEKILIKTPKNAPKQQQTLKWIFASL